MPQQLPDAALTTPGVESEPKPFLLKTTLNDWYPTPQINAYTGDTNPLTKIYSDLHQNIQDKFNASGVTIMSPQFMTYRNANESTISKEKRT